MRRRFGSSIGLELIVSVDLIPVDRLSLDGIGIFKDLRNNDIAAELRLAYSALSNQHRFTDSLLRLSLT